MKGSNYNSNSSDNDSNNINSDNNCNNSNSKNKDKNNKENNSVPPNKCKSNNTYNRVKHKKLRSLKILTQMMIISDNYVMIILAMVAIIILIHLTIKIPYDVSITQEIHCSYLWIVLSKTLI